MGVEDEDIIGAGETARLLGVSKPTMRRAVRDGILRPAIVTPGGWWRFRRHDVLALRERLIAELVDGEQLGDQPPIGQLSRLRRPVPRRPAPPSR